MRPSTTVSDMADKSALLLQRQAVVTILEKHRRKYSSNSEDEVAEGTIFAEFDSYLKYSQARHYFSHNTKLTTMKCYKSLNLIGEQARKDELF